MTYEVKINMEPHTVEALKAAGYKMYGFKAVKSQNASGKPTVWFTTDKFLTTTIVRWEEDYKAYISDDKPIAGGVVHAQVQERVNPEETMNVDQYGNCRVVDGSVKSNDLTHPISVYNQGEEEWTCGVAAKKLDGTYESLCAFPLYGGNLNAIEPIEKIFLMFATEAIKTETVIEQSFGPGILIDLTGKNYRSLTYDKNKTWGDYGSHWATAHEPRSNLNPLLIESV